MHRLPLLGSTPWSGLAIKNREGALLLFIRGALPAIKAANER